MGIVADVFMGKWENWRKFSRENNRENWNCGIGPLS
jgi:hypothetical protein